MWRNKREIGRAPPSAGTTIHSRSWVPVPKMPTESGCPSVALLIIKHKPAHAVPVASARPDQNPKEMASQPGPGGPWPTGTRWRVLAIANRRFLRGGGCVDVLASTATLHRALRDGRPGFPGADGRLPARSRCGRVCVKFYLLIRSRAVFATKRHGTPRFSPFISEVGWTFKKSTTWSPA